MRATSLSQVSEIAIVTESECRTPTLIGSVVLCADNGFVVRVNVLASSVAWRNNFLFMDVAGKNRQIPLTIRSLDISASVVPAFVAAIQLLETLRRSCFQPLTIRWISPAIRR